MRGVVLVFIVLVAGCVEVEHPTVEPVPEPIPQNQPLLAPNVAEVDWIAHPLNLGGCETSVTFLLVKFEEAAAWLPPGFHPADLRQFATEYTPLASDYTTLHVASMSCQINNLANEPYDVAMVGFLVKPPLVSEVEGEADFNFYNVEFYTDRPFLQEFLGASGWAWRGAGVTQNFAVYPDDLEEMVPVALPPVSPPPETALPPPVPSRLAYAISLVEIGLPADPWFDGRAGGAYPLVLESPPLIRFWHLGDASLGFMQYQLEERTFPAMIPARCDVKVGSPIHDILGRETCDPEVDPPLASFGLMFPEHDLQGFLLDMPGVTPG